MLDKIKKYAPTYLAALGLVLVGAYNLLADGWQAQDGAQLAIVFLGTVGVWYFPSTEVSKAAKFLAMLGIAGVGQWIVVWPDGVTFQEWISIGIAVLTAAGVLAVPNKPSPPPLR